MCSWRSGTAGRARARLMPCSKGVLGRLTAQDLPPRLLRGGQPDRQVYKFSK